MGCNWRFRVLGLDPKPENLTPKPQQWRSLKPKVVPEPVEDSTLDPTSKQLVSKNLYNPTRTQKSRPLLSLNPKPQTPENTLKALNASKLLLTNLDRRGPPPHPPLRVQGSGLSPQPQTLHRKPCTRNPRKGVFRNHRIIALNPPSLLPKP